MDGNKKKEKKKEKKLFKILCIAYEPKRDLMCIEHGFRVELRDGD